MYFMRRGRKEKSYVGFKSKISWIPFLIFRKALPTHFIVHDFYDRNHYIKNKKGYVYQVLVSALCSQNFGLIFVYVLRPKTYS